MRLTTGRYRPPICSHPGKGGEEREGGGAENSGESLMKGGRPGGTVPPGVGPFGVASANPYVYTPTPLIHPRKWGKKEEGGGCACQLLVLAVHSSRPQS